MSNPYARWYGEFKDLIDTISEDKLFDSFDELIHSSRNTFAMNRKIMEKVIDVSWVEAIENGIIHLDNFMRNPRKTIEDVEEIVPIALSKKITIESVKHLAQHTDYIQSVDKKTGKITPSKILNVHKEESLMTYENKFVNTLVDRLFIFINTRYEKLAQVAKDEKVMAMDYDTDIDDGSGGKLKVSLKVETIEDLDSRDENGVTIWQRVEKLKKAIEGYKGSELCKTLGNTFIRPPVMRTNAIMKNVDLKACLTLWQYIESYDKVGYEINVENTAVKPEQDYIEDFYKIIILNFLLFRSYTGSEKTKLEELKTQRSKPLAPKFVKKFDKELASDYGVSSETTAGYVTSGGELQFIRKLPDDLSQVYEQINAVIDIEKEYLKKREIARQEQERQRLEEEQRQLEAQRIEEARQAELERIRLQREEEERQLQEMLAKKRAEQEAAEKERARLEEERLARLEELRKREEEERIKREEEERIAAERARLEEEKHLVRSELGDAEGINLEQLRGEEIKEELEKQQAYNSVTDAEIEEAKAAMEERSEEGEAEFEDPREVAARLKLEQQKREKERQEKERAQRLKAERQYFESKSFKEIRREYTKNPFFAIPRLIRYILAMVFGIIPEDTDRPDFKAKRAAIAEKKRLREEEKKKHNEMEFYYKKYAQTFKYRFMRKIADYKFKKRKRKESRGKPLPVYKPPVRTAEEQAAHTKYINELYRTYHVSRIERIKRRIAEIKRNYSSEGS